MNMYYKIRHKLHSHLESHGREAMPSISGKPVPFESDGRVPVRFFIGTGDGLLLYDKGNLIRLLDGYYYGISKFRSKWYAFRKIRSTGQLITFTLKDNSVADIEPILFGLSHDVHQIDICRNRLFLMDTGKNRVIRFTLNEQGHIYNRSKYFYPSGKIDYSQKVNNFQKGDNIPPNYAHMNSIFIDKGIVYLMYHSNTSKTGRKSQVAVTNLRFDNVRLLSTNFSEGHNILNLDGKMYCCGSREGWLVCDGKPVLKVNSFTRGLAANETFIIVGGSEFGSRHERNGTKGFVYILDRQCKLVATLKISGVNPLQEIRIADGLDFARSNSVEKLV
jgi:hypothetical protein